MTLRARLMLLIASVVGIGAVGAVSASYAVTRQQLYREGDRSLEDRVDAYLAQIAQTEPVVVGRMKRHLQALAQRAADEPEAVALQASMARAAAESLRSPALKARLDALLER